MTAQILDGRALATALKGEVADGVARFREAYGRAPRLDIFLVGEDPGSAIYVRHKEKAALEVGLEVVVHRVASEVTQSALASLLAGSNADDAVDGVLLQLPLPEGLPAGELLDGIAPTKDVDALHPQNLGLLALGRAPWAPPTPAGVMRLLSATGLDLDGKHAVMIGRSAIVGKPLAAMLLAADATVTAAHTHTRDLAQLCREADVIVAAAGSPELVRGSWIKPGAVVIDVGQSTGAQGKLVGDVAFDEARERASFLTKVPGGVGPMTVACLLLNTLSAARARERASGI
jgi:methylenetetrahydrofolate dehydrogenase (NADP+)/methenyltetrahydrofolate cyclohydrolase